MSVMKLRLKMLVILSGLSVVVVTLGYACSPVGTSVNGGSSFLSSSCSVKDPELEVIPGERTVSLVYGRQVLDNMVSCLGIGSASARTYEEWERRSNSLSEYGYATQVTAPMMMAIAAVAGEACEDLMQREIAQVPVDRSFFNEINFAQGTQSLSASILEPAIIRLAKSCWQRFPDEAEIDLILDEVDAAQSGTSGADPSQAKKVALLICTGVLSSLSAIEM